MLKAIVFSIPFALLFGCAGSASHQVMSEYEATDKDLTCSEIKQETFKAQSVLDAVNKDKADLTASDITDGIFWFPFNLIAKSTNTPVSYTHLTLPTNREV